MPALDWRGPPDGGNRADNADVSFDVEPFLDAGTGAIDGWGVTATFDARSLEHAKELAERVRQIVEADRLERALAPSTPAPRRSGLALVRP